MATRKIIEIEIRIQTKQIRKQHQAYPHHLIENLQDYLQRKKVAKDPKDAPGIAAKDIPTDSFV